MTDWTNYNDELLDQAMWIHNLDAALKHVFDVIDPHNTSDLGGIAGHWFSIPIEYRFHGENALRVIDANEAWPDIDILERRTRLAKFFTFVRNAL